MDLDQLMSNSNAAADAMRQQREEFVRQAEEQERMNQARMDADNQARLQLQRSEQERQLQQQQEQQIRQPAAAAQESFLKEMTKLLKAGRKKNDKDEDSDDDIDIKGDMFDLDARANGAIGFSVEEFACDILPKQYGSILMDIINKLMSMDKSLKRGDALKAAKFNAFIFGMPRLILDALIHRRMRIDLKCGKSLQQAICEYFTISREFNGFCMRYHNEVQVNCVYKLGQRIGSKKRYDGCIVSDVRKSIEEATFNRTMLSGYARTLKRSADSKWKSKNNNNGNNNGNKKSKTSNIDFSIYNNKSSAKFIPAGWCVFHFAAEFPACKSGNRCRFKHIKWTQAEYDAAKAA